MDTYDITHTDTKHKCYTLGPLHIKLEFPIVEVYIIAFLLPSCFIDK